jgi:hypothetical protein
MDLTILEKIAGGTIGGAGVLAVMVWQLWTRTKQQDQQLTALTERFMVAVAEMQATVKDNTHAVNALLSAIDSRR